MTLVKNFLRDDSGQDLIEYALLLAFICLFSAAVFISVGQEVSGIWSVAKTRDQHGGLGCFRLA
jgi:Flp pilus assembly pilin Flp